MIRFEKIKKALKIIAGVLILLILIGYFGFAYPVWGMFFNQKRHGNPPLTPPWALECWLWEDDHNTAEYVDTLLAGYAKYDIPVRTILLDSPWSTKYNDYHVDTVLYPNPKEWFGKLEQDGYRVVLWTTTMVDSRDKDTRHKDSTGLYNYAAGMNYLTGGDNQIKWWKGKGGFIDYTNSEAMKWWRGLQNQVFELGIDDWKLDGTATLFYRKFGPLPIFYQSTHEGIMTARKYMDHYYTDEYFYGLTQNPEFITLSRAVDRNYHPEGFAPIQAAPVTWVGDQKHAWKSEANNSDGVDIAMEGIEGIEMAMENIMKSAELGYNIIGSDIGGFSGKEIPPRLYIRWAGFSAFCGLFLNGGHGERALWKRTPPELEIIRKFSWLHTELIPYMYSYVVEGHKGKAVLQRPVRGKFHYMFGDNFLVAPIYKDDLENEVHLPKGKWRYFFDDSEIFEGPQKLKKQFPLDEYPVFVREGAIVPMNIKRSYTKIGSETSEGYITYLIYPNGASEFTVYYPDKSGSTTVRVKEDANKITVDFSGTKKPHILNIKLANKQMKVELDHKLLDDLTGYYFDYAGSKLVIKTSSYANGFYTIMK